MKKILLTSLLLITITGCSEFAMLMSGTGFAASQNSFVKVYNAADFGVVLTTKKGIKQHAYEKGKKSIYDNTIKLFGNKH